MLLSQPFMHRRSRDVLLGKDIDSALDKYYSNKYQVKEDNPRTFIIHASDDNTGSVQNSLVFYKALIEKGIPVEIYI